MTSMSNTERRSYERALQYLSMAPFIPIETIGLVSYLFSIDGKLVASDIDKARRGVYKYEA
jgi:hypothetical protein